MHNVKRFLGDSVFESPQDARARAAAEGNPRPEDMIPLYRKRTQIDSSGREIETHARSVSSFPQFIQVLNHTFRYFVVDSAEALQKFGQDAWDRVVCVMTTGQAWQFKPYKWNDPKVLFHHGKLAPSQCTEPLLTSVLILVKGFYISLTSDPPNHKIKDWNVTELKVRVSLQPLPGTAKTYVLDRC